MLGLKPTASCMTTGSARSYIRFATDVRGGRWNYIGRPAGVASMIQGGPLDSARIARVFRCVRQLVVSLCGDKRPVLGLDTILLADALEYVAGVRVSTDNVARLRVVVDQLYLIVFDSLQVVNAEGYSDEDEVLNNIAFKPSSPELDMVRVFRTKLLVLADGLRYPAEA